VMLAFSSTFISPYNSSWGLTLQCLLNLFLGHCLMTWKPCSILFVNYVYTAGMMCSFWFAVMALWDNDTDVQWWPFIFFLLGTSIILVRYCKLAAPVVHGGPILSLADIGDTSVIQGGKTKSEDSIDFDIMSCLRGRQHRLRQLTFWGNGDWDSVYEIQCIVEVDGSIFRCPRFNSLLGGAHTVNGTERTKWEWCLDPDDKITEIYTKWIPNHLRITFKTAKGKIWRMGQKKEHGAELSDDEFDFHFKAEEGSDIVGIHGVQGETMLSLGAIYQGSIP